MFQICLAERINDRPVQRLRYRQTGQNHLASGYVLHGVTDMGIVPVNDNRSTRTQQHIERMKVSVTQPIAFRQFAKGFQCGLFEIGGQDVDPADDRCQELLRG